MATKNGTRLRCATCGAEFIVLQAEEPQLVCCGQEMDVVFATDAKADEQR